MTSYEKHCREACGWCAKHINRDNKVTAVLKQSHPQPVHKVYPPYVDGPFSDYVGCDAPTFEDFAEQMADRAEKAEAALTELGNKTGYLLMALGQIQYCRENGKPVPEISRLLLAELHALASEPSVEFHGMAVVADSEMPRDEIQLRDKDGAVVSRIVNVAEPVASEKTDSPKEPGAINIPGHHMYCIIAADTSFSKEMRGSHCYVCECGWKLDVEGNDDPVKKMAAHQRALEHLADKVLKSAASHVGQTK